MRLPSLRTDGGPNARSSQTPNRNPAGIVAPKFVKGDLLAEYAPAGPVRMGPNVVNATDEPCAGSACSGSASPAPGRYYPLTGTARSQKRDLNAQFFLAALPKRIFLPRFNRYGGAASCFGDHARASSGSKAWCEATRHAACC